MLTALPWPALGLNTSFCRVRVLCSSSSPPAGDAAVAGAAPPVEASAACCAAQAAEVRRCRSGSRRGGALCVGAAWEVRGRREAGGAGKKRRRPVAAACGRLHDHYREPMASHVLRGRWMPCSRRSGGSLKKTEVQGAPCRHGWGQLQVSQRCHLLVGCLPRMEPQCATVQQGKGGNTRRRGVCVQCNALGDADSLDYSLLTAESQVWSVLPLVLCVASVPLAPGQYFTSLVDRMQRQTTTTEGSRQ